MSELNEKYFPKHRQKHEIRIDINALEKQLKNSEDEEDDEASTNSLTTKLLELKLEYATADHFELSLSQMYLSRIDSDYFKAMQKAREKHQAVVSARRELMKHQESIK